MDNDITSYIRKALHEYLKEKYGGVRVIDVRCAVAELSHDGVTDVHARIRYVREKPPEPDVVVGG